TPHDKGGNVILAGNTQVRLWNNILPSIALDAKDMRPTFESNNLVVKGGGGSMLITEVPHYQDTTSYELAADSPGLDRALVDAQTPTEDRLYRARGSAPDVGALERGAASVRCSP